MKNKDEEVWEYAHRLRRSIKKPKELNAFAIVLVLCLLVYVTVYMLIN